MQISNKYKALKQKFGQEMKKDRLKKKLSSTDAAYILGIGQSVYWAWETGKTFPGDIIRLQKLKVLFPNVQNNMNVLIAGLIASIPKNKLKEIISIKPTGRQIYVPTYNRYYIKVKEERDKKYKKEFGKYLRSKRIKMGLSAYQISSLLNMAVGSYSAWEAGKAFPSDLKALAILDKLYGNVIEVMFGTCKKEGIRIRRKEIEKVLKRKHKFDNTKIKTWNKPQPAVYLAWKKNKYKKEGKRIHHIRESMYTKKFKAVISSQMTKVMKAWHAVPKNYNANIKRLLRMRKIRYGK